MILSPIIHPHVKEWLEQIRVSVDLIERAWASEQPAQPADPPPPPAEKWLRWPSLAPDKKLTQAFGANPQNYARLGLPGHEGIDIRAPHATPIIAAADGEVVRVDFYADDKAKQPYGHSVRIRHRRAEGEYGTIYAHLIDNSAKVKVGQWVTAGTVIGLADSTGNSSADHLHFGLKKLLVQTGDPFRGYVDPLPFVIDPP